MRNSEAEQAAWKAHVEELKKQTAKDPEPIINGPKIASPRSGPVDRDPLFGGTVLRQRKNRPPAKKRIVSQTRFDEDGNMAKRVPQAANAKGKLNQITPIETEANIKPEDQIDPDENAIKARQQHHIIADYYAKRNPK